MLVDAYSTFRLIHGALGSSRWPAERMRQRQEDRLRKLIAHAYRNVPLYRSLYDEVGFCPDEFRTLDDLDKIPLLQKQRLKEASAEERIARGIDPARCTTVRTSGSTGAPLRIYLGPHDQRWQRAVAWRILFEHGYRWTDRTLEIRMTFGPRFHVQRFGIAPKEWLSILDSPESWARRLDQTRPEILVASAGTLHALAKAVETLGFAPPHPRIIISDSETLAPATRRVVHRALGTDPVDVFGLVELSNFAWECEQRRGYHVSADSHLVEVNAPSGKPGPVIVTAFGMWTMPLIRYETGDFVELDCRSCSCGRTLPLLGCLHGRGVDSVILPNGQRLFWPYFHELLGSYTSLRQWRILQHDARRLRIQLAAPHGHMELFAKIERDLRRVLPESMDLLVERVETIPSSPGEKTRMIFSRAGRTENAHANV